MTDDVIVLSLKLPANERLQFLMDVGLHYLSLDRAAGTLAGQRRFARSPIA